MQSQLLPNFPSWPLTSDSPLPDANVRDRECFPTRTPLTPLSCQTCTPPELISGAHPSITRLQISSPRHDADHQVPSRDLERAGDGRRRRRPAAPLGPLAAGRLLPAHGAGGTRRRRSGATVSPHSLSLSIASYARSFFHVLVR